jgi:flagellar biosynthetic protein FliQ
MERTLIVALQLGGPIVLAALAVGLVVSIFQAATQINEATLTFVPKLLVVAGILVVLGPSMIQALTDLTRFVVDVAAASAPVNR